MKVIKVSQLLSENEALGFIDRFQNIELSSFTLATGIVQVFKNYLGEWMLIHFGVLYLLLDKCSNSYYLKLYSPKDASSIWQQGIYQKFIYVSANSFFHMFEGDDAVFGFNFSDIQEAHSFGFSLNQHVLMNSSTFQTHNQVIKMIKNINWDWFSGLSFGASSMKISQPTNIKHVTHVGLDSIFGEDANREIVAEIRKILKLQTNVPSKIYDDPDMHDYVNFIACELRKHNKCDSSEGQITTETSRRTTQPPPISWSLENELKNVSNLFFNSPSKNEQIESFDNNGADNRRSLANAIAVAIANRNICMHNYSDTDDNSSFDSDCKSFI